MSVHILNFLENFQVYLKFAIALECPERYEELNNKHDKLFPLQNKIHQEKAKRRGGQALAASGINFGDH